MFIRQDFCRFSCKIGIILLTKSVVSITMYCKLNVNKGEEKDSSTGLDFQRHGRMVGGCDDSLI
jgi:hypothetical protein